jgi:hypothetical protein
MDFFEHFRVLENLITPLTEFMLSLMEQRDFFISPAVLLRQHLLSRKIAGFQVPAPQLDLLSKIADV